MASLNSLNKLSNQISLKIKIVETSQVKTIQFSQDLKVWEACQEVINRVGGSSDHSFYWPAQTSWLDLERGLNFYDLKNGDEIEFKKKHRPLKVRMMDDTLKTVLIDETMLVQQLVETVCERIGTISSLKQGISNPEEYSFAPDISKTDKDEKKSSSKEDLTDVKWLNPEKTLQEQGIKDTDAIMLKKKFFFSDQNVDRNDPIQFIFLLNYRLNLLYVQSREGVLSGKLPVTLDESILFAAIQCQIAFGNNDPDKMKSGFIKYIFIQIFRLKDFLPPEYAKKKELDKKIFSEHRKLNGLTELNAKYRYVQLCRSLKTYGVTFFEVKERPPKSGKVFARLLGVTRESVLRVDAETKEILKVWSLTNLRSFTLDFGDYADAYYTFSTPDGEAISQLIGGYIDIILKKRKEADKPVPRLQSMSNIAVEEEVVRTGHGFPVSTSKAAISQRISMNMPHSVSSMSAGGTMTLKRKGVHLMNITSLPTGQFGGGEIAAQESFLNTVQVGFASVNSATQDMAMAAELPPLGNDAAAQQWKQTAADVNKENISAHVAAHLAAICAVLNQTSVEPDTIDYNVLGGNVSTITSNLSHLSTNTKVVASLLPDDESEALLSSGRKFAEATSKFLTLIGPVISEEQDARSNLCNAAKNIGEASSEMISNMQEPLVAENIREKVTNCAEGLLSATMALVTSGRSAATSMGNNQDKQRQLISANKLSNLQAQQIVAEIQTIMPFISSTICQDQVLSATAMLKDAVTKLSDASKSCQNEQLVMSVSEQARRVNEAIASLINYMKNGSLPVGNEMERAYDDLLAAVMHIKASFGDTSSIMIAVKDLGVATTSLVNAVKQKAQKSTEDNEKQEISAVAKRITDTSAKVQNAARESARFPTDQPRQTKVTENINELQSAANAALGESVKTKVYNKLSVAARKQAYGTIHLLTAVRVIAPSNRDQASQVQLNQAAKKVMESNNVLISSIRAYLANPDDEGTQKRLDKSVRAVFNPSEVFMAAAKSAAPMVFDPAAQSQLQHFIAEQGDTLADLQYAVQFVDGMSSGFDLVEAIQLLNTAKMQNTDAIENIGSLETEEIHPVEEYHKEYQATLQNANGSLALLQAAIRRGTDDAISSNAKVMADNINLMTHVAKEIIASSPDQPSAAPLLDVVSSIIDSSLSLLSSVKQLTENPDSTDKEMIYNNIESLKATMALAVKNLPSQKDVDAVVENISETSTRLAMLGDDELKRETFVIGQNKLGLAATAINVATNRIFAASRGNGNELKTAAQELGIAYKKLVDAARILAARTQDEIIKEKIISETNDAGEKASKMLLAAKVASVDPSYKNQLNYAGKTLSETVNTILNICSSASPGQSECITAIHILNTSTTKLQNVNEVALGLKKSYAESVSSVVDHSAKLSSITATILNFIQSAQTENVASIIQQCSYAAEALTLGTIRAAYLIALNDPASQPGVPGVIDPLVITEASSKIDEACRDLENPNNGKNEILESASTIAKSTAEVCNMCKEAAKRNDVDSKSQELLVASVKQIASGTAGLVGKIKELANDPNPAARAQVAKVSKNLTKAVADLREMASGETLGPSPAIIATIGEKAQQPLIDANRNVVNTLIESIGTVRSLLNTPRDQNLLELLNAQTRSLGDSIKTLTSVVAQSAPGQKEVVASTTKVTSRLGELESAMVKAAAGGLKDNSQIDYEVVKAKLLSDIRGLTSVSMALQRGESTNIGANVTQLADTFSQITTNAISAAAKAFNKDQQKVILERGKEVGESLIKLLDSVKGGKSNSENTGTIRDNLGGTLKQLSIVLEGSNSAAAEMSSTIAEVEQQVMSNNAEESEATESFAVYSNEIGTSSRNIVDIIGEIVSKSTNQDNVQKIQSLADQLALQFKKVSEKGKLGAIAATDDNVKNSLQGAVRGLGGSIVGLLESIKGGINRLNDPASRLKITNSAKEVSLEVSKVMTSLQDGSKGSIQCEEAITKIDDIVIDIDSTLIFATAGQLDPVSDKEKFGDYKPHMIATAKSFIEVAKSIAAAAASTSSELGAAASNSLINLKNLKEDVKKAAAAVTSSDRDSQELLLNSTKNVAQSLQQYIASASDASSDSKTAMANIKDGARMFAASITEFIQIVNAVGDESSRASRAIEGAKANIDEMIDELRSGDPGQGTALPEEVAGLAKSVATAAAQLVASSGGNQELIILATNKLKKTLEDLLRAGKAATEKAPEDSKKLVRKAVEAAAIAAQGLLEGVARLQEKGSAENKAALQTSTKEIVGVINDVVTAVGKLIPGGYVDPNDPNVIAERELLAAASSIEAAALKLASLQPPERPAEANQELTFDKQIMEAAKAIASATSALLRSATGAQREIIANTSGVKKGAKKEAYFSDGTWSDGLVSAAKAVAYATGDLCESADAAVKGTVERERVIASAKSVSIATTQLLTAAAVKTDPDSQTQIRLRAAGKSIKNATEQLVKAAENALVFEDDGETATKAMKDGVNVTKIKEMEAQMNVYKMEQELEKARLKLAGVRKNRYDKGSVRFKGTIRGKMPFDNGEQQ